jgi:predicted DNA-binding ribbon-helix-helix protein
MKFAVIKRSIAIDGFKTSISLEDEFWYGLLEIAEYKKITVPALVKQISRASQTDNLSSAIRLFVFRYLRVKKRRPVRRKRRKRLTLALPGSETPPHD